MFLLSRQMIWCPFKLTCPHRPITFRNSIKIVHFTEFSSDRYWNCLLKFNHSMYFLFILYFIKERSYASSIKKKLHWSVVAPAFLSKYFPGIPAIDTGIPRLQLFDSAVLIGCLTCWNNIG